MNNLKSVLACVVLAAAFVLPGCASLEGPFDSGDILASMQNDSHTGGD